MVLRTTNLAALDGVAAVRATSPAPRIIMGAVEGAATVEVGAALVKAAAAATVVVVVAVAAPG